MVEFETPSELAVSLADMLGIYRCGPENGDHPEGCNCRICFVEIMEDRIRDSVENDKFLKCR